jgi:hypothetical protein
MLCGNTKGKSLGNSVLEKWTFGVAGPSTLPRSDGVGVGYKDVKVSLRVAS